jgi:hypothetical protein
MWRHWPIYNENATNHQVADTPVDDAIREMFASGFAKAKMVCIAEHIDGEWGIIEWRDPSDLRPL